MDAEDILFRIWLYRSKDKWRGVIDLMMAINSVFVDASEALLGEDDHKVIRLMPRNRGKDIPQQWYPLIETRLLAPLLTKSITPFLGHVFGAGKLCTVINLKFKFQEKVIKDLKTISPAEYAKRAGRGHRADWPDNYHTKRKVVFLCYSSKDKRFVRKLADELFDNSVDVWVDYNQILAGQEFIKRIEQGIVKCDFVVVILTSNFIQGPWAKRELRMAINREVSEDRITVLPLLKKDCEIPEILKIKTYVDFRGHRFERGLKLLLRSINELP